MEKEEKIIHTTLLETKLADERLSAYATKNSECIKVKKTIQPSMDFDIRWPFELYVFLFKAVRWITYLKRG